MSNESFCVRDCYDRLREDKFRSTVPFSPEMELTNEILFHPFASAGQKKEAIQLWLQAHQPCVFGQIAAAKNRLHYCVINDTDLQRSDESIANKISNERLRWKRRSLRPTPEFAPPAHGFILVIASKRVAFASPDDRLKEFAEQFLRLWECQSSRTEAGTVFWESLFLQKYPSKECLKFTFSIDFFAAQGDGRWWMDHRFPGGIAFTANSVGHNRRYKEWFEKASKQDAWMLRTAMSTIDSAQDTEYGKATWLKSLASGQPVVDHLSPLFDAPRFADKDWTRYGGYLHTDLSIRDEFFSEQADLPDEVKGRSSLQDFSYLYDEKNSDHVQFAAGEKVTFDQVVEEIGHPESYVEIDTPQIRTAFSSQDFRVEKLLQQCRGWAISRDKLVDLDT